MSLRSKDTQSQPVTATAAGDDDSLQPIGRLIELTSDRTLALVLTATGLRQLLIVDVAWSLPVSGGQTNG